MILCNNVKSPNNPGESLYQLWKQRDSQESTSMNGAIRQDLKTERLMLFSLISGLSGSLRSEFLRYVGLLGSKENSNVIEVRLWYTFQVSSPHSREIDALVECNDKIILVENKLNSPIDVEQLVDELKLGSEEFEKQGKAVQLAVITSHNVQPKEIEVVTKRTKTEIKWINWSKCANVAQNLLSREGVDEVSKYNLTQLYDFLNSQRFEAEPAFSKDDDWISYSKIWNNVHRLAEAVSKVGEQLGFDSWSSIMESYPSYARAFDGLWSYLEKGEEERGFYVAIGLIEGELKLEFAWYEKRKHRSFQGLVSKGYTWNEKRWSHPNTKVAYDYYSQFLDFKELEGKSFSEQKDLIIDYIKSHTEDYKSCVN
jgi:hypothetical protein